MRARISKLEMECGSEEYYYDRNAQPQDTSEEEVTKRNGKKMGSMEILKMSGI